MIMLEKSMVRHSPWSSSELTQNFRPALALYEPEFASDKNARNFRFVQETLTGTGERQ